MQQELSAVILAGGRGLRMGPTYQGQPKALVPVVGKPVISHVMDWLGDHGIVDFVIAAGYRANELKGFFFEETVLSGDVRLDMRNGTVTRMGPGRRLSVIVADTGEGCESGSRLRSVMKYASDPFVLVYCDILTDVDLTAVLRMHAEAGRIGTLVAVRALSPYGVLRLEEHLIRRFQEKPIQDDEWINAGVMVLSHRIAEFGGDGDVSLERDILPELADRGELAVYRHEGYWRSVDTPKDVIQIEDSLQSSGLRCLPWRLVQA